MTVPRLQPHPGLVQPLRAALEYDDVARAIEEPLLLPAETGGIWFTRDDEYLGIVGRHGGFGVSETVRHRHRLAATGETMRQQQ
ncbi:hypothetical protein Raf01_07330 [Rugosimonospora africana]|uniref:Uncharacterized protein n=1 Tax=Rugosimonospora africana TaxID=556532 RepID=A0A8J3QP16_9ACTN|nr:hypothetical protein Raf01_07330 [Rugosimonospora africana]